MSDISIRWYDRDKSVWVPFDLADINHQPVLHALNLFGRNAIPTEAVQGGRYVVSTLRQFNDLKKTGTPVFSFRQLLLDGGAHLSRPFHEAGFFGGAL
jgi:hypothetical protein